MPKKLLTLLAGCFADVSHYKVKNFLIRFFIKVYQVDMDEAHETNINNYPSFNAFFIRSLKPECRPLAQTGLISPVDGYISEFGRLEQGKLLQAKGHYYDVNQLLANSPLSKQFKQGCFITLYLAPHNYHRVHIPTEATLLNMVYIPGSLFSVQPATVRTIPNLFSRNERLVAFFETPIGLMAMVLVGATLVGKIGTRWQGEIQRSRESNTFDYSQTPLADVHIQQGDEIGYFKLGSTVILLFADANKVVWDEGLYSGKSLRYGEALGEIISKAVTA